MLVKSILGFVLMTLFVSHSFAADAIQDETNETLMPKGMWKDPKTNLIWMRCSYGETFANGTCTGSPTLMSWADAVTLNDKKYEDLNNGVNVWRLPTMEELHGIIDCGHGLFSGFQEKGEFYDNSGNLHTFDTFCKGRQKENDFNDLTLDNQIFPEKTAKRERYQDGMFWTIYASKTDYNKSGYISFNRGSYGFNDAPTHYAVRLVKGGDMAAYFKALPHVQSKLLKYENFVVQKSEMVSPVGLEQKSELAKAESQRLLNGRNGDPTKYSTTKGNPQCKFFDGFIINGDGTATDPRNNLTWKRCPEGANWEGSFCSAGAKKMDWGSAMDAAKQSNFLGKKDWRLPTINELESIAGNYESGCKNNFDMKGAYAVSPVLASPLNLYGDVGESWSTTKFKQSRNTRDTRVFLQFNTGFGYPGDYTNTTQVRLVRSDSIASRQEFDRAYDGLETARLQEKLQPRMAESGFGSGLTLENFFASDEYQTVLKNFTPTVEAFKNDYTFGIKVIYPKKTFEFTKTASCKSNGTSSKEGRVGYFEDWLGSVKSKTLIYDNFTCSGDKQDFVKFEKKLTGQTTASSAFDSTWNVERLAKTEIERYGSSAPSALHKYTSYQEVSRDSMYKTVKVRCLPDASYTKEETLWRTDSGKYTVTGWLGSSYPFDEAARRVCRIE
jgi:hypothetical protein